MSKYLIMILERFNKEFISSIGTLKTEGRMVYKITNACINCGYCKLECPSNAIYEPGMSWSMAEGTGLQGTLTLLSGRKVDSFESLAALSDEFYYIVPEKCTGCKEEFSEPQCQIVCPDPLAIITLPNRKEINYSSPS